VRIERIVIAHRDLLRHPVGGSGECSHMGFIRTRWEASHEGHSITVNRNEIGRGFTLEWDGRVIARRAWSPFGLGELHGTVEVDGRPRELHLTLSVGSGPGEGLLTDGRCTVSVDGAPVAMTHIR
jgi:hypothetical protein